MGLALMLSSEPPYLDDRADRIEGWTPEFTPTNQTNAIVRISCAPNFLFFIRLCLPLYDTAPFHITTLRNDLLLALDAVLLLNTQHISINPTH